MSPAERLDGCATPGDFAALAGRALGEADTLRHQLEEERRLTTALQVRVESLHAELDALRADFETAVGLLRERLALECGDRLAAVARAGDLAVEVLRLRRALADRERLAAGLPGIGPGIVAGMVS